MNHFLLTPSKLTSFFQNYKSKFVESESIATKKIALNQIYMHIGFNRLVHFAPTILPRSILHDSPLSRPKTHQLASLNYVCLFDVWDHTFNKLEQALTYASLPWWMHSFWLQLYAFHCFYVIKSWSSVFDKLIRAPTSFDLSSTFQLNMEWLLLHKFLDCQEGYSLGALLHLTRYKRSYLSPLFILFSFVYICCLVLFLLFLFKF